MQQIGLLRDLTKQRAALLTAEETENEKRGWFKMGLRYTEITYIHQLINLLKFLNIIPVVFYVVAH